MKKVISISLSFLMLTALLHLTIATHYCGGMVADSRISLTGKVATCGMEDDQTDQDQTDYQYKSHCCENVLVFVGVSNNYFPTFSSVPESYQVQIQQYGIPVGLSSSYSTSENSICTSVSPPGQAISSGVDLSSICVFRI